MKALLPVFCLVLVGLSGCQPGGGASDHAGHNMEPGHALHQEESNPTALAWLQQRLAQTDTAVLPLLTDQKGRSQAVLRPGIQVLSFLYTRCPDPRICPLTVRSIQTALLGLPATDRPRVSLSVVTLDPQFDTPEVLAQYGTTTGLSGLDGAVQLLTGSIPDVQQWADLFSIGGVMDGATDHANHTMHTLATFVLRDGALLARLGGTTWAPSQLQAQVVDALRTSQYNQPASENPAAGDRAAVHTHTSVTNQTGENQ